MFFPATVDWNEPLARCALHNLHMFWCWLSGCSIFFISFAVFSFTFSVFLSCFFILWAAQIWLGVGLHGNKQNIRESRSLFESLSGVPSQKAKSVLKNFLILAILQDIFIKLCLTPREHPPNWTSRLLDSKSLQAQYGFLQVIPENYGTESRNRLYSIFRRWYCTCGLHLQILGSPKQPKPKGLGLGRKKISMGKRHEMG